MDDSPHSSFSISLWLLRGLLAVMLAFGTEILLWINPTATTPVDLLLKVITYLALACILLDLTVRYRVQDLYGVMLVVPFFALGAGLLINAEFAHAEFPNSLITRVIGANGTFGLMMVGLLLALTNQHNLRYRRLLLGYSLWLGFYWGVWLRWTPETTDLIEGAVSFEAMMLAFAGFMVVIIALFAVWVRTTQTDSDDALKLDDLKLSVIGWGVVASTLLLVLMIRAVEGVIELGPLLSSAGLMAVSWAILWSQRNEKGRTILDKHIPPKAIQPQWIIAAIILFVIMAAIGYNRPLIDIDEVGQHTFMQVLFAVVGFTWFPLVASVMSVRAIDRQSRISPGY